jgi:hypothetical protein
MNSSKPSVFRHVAGCMMSPPGAPLVLLPFPYPGRPPCTRSTGGARFRQRRTRARVRPAEVGQPLVVLVGSAPRQGYDRRITALGRIEEDEQRRATMRGHLRRSESLRRVPPRGR